MRDGIASPSPRVGGRLAILSRLASLDKALVLILVPIWAVCFTLSVRTAVLQTVRPSVYVSASSAEDGYPAIAGFRSWEFQETDLRVGDRLLRLGEEDLRGVGPLGFQGVVAEAAGANRHPTVVFERAGEHRQAPLPVVPYSSDWPRLPVSLAFALTAVLVFLRVPASPEARAGFPAFMCVAVSQATRFIEGRPEAYAAFVFASVFVTLAYPLCLRAALLFPEGVPPRSWWARVWPWFLVYGPLTVSSRFGFPFPAEFGRQAGGVVEIAAFATVLAVLTRSYRRSDAIERRQLKWLLFGFYCALVPTITASALSVVRPELSWLWTPSMIAFVLMPASMVIAVARYNFLDVDRVVSAAASYNILFVLLGAGVLVVVPRVAEATSGLLGMDPGTSQIALSLLLAGVVVPAQRRLRPQIDRLFFKERYALDQGISELLLSLSTCTGTRELTERVGEALHRVLRPEPCVVYAAVEDSYAPVFVEGRAVPPAFAATSPLIGTLLERGAPLALGNAGRRPDPGPLSPFDRAALETLRAEVVVPVRQNDALAAFVCLGPKRSGDLYTSTDLSLLAAVAETVAHQLQRFDQDEVIRVGREMQESLRRYVPGAVAEQLSGGADLLASSEREVSVLFVDIRGYTSFSEDRRAEEIFSTVNRYTATVSQIVSDHGGSVVEFNGDGMMAIFGAPRELAHKERAAVEAGREIVTAVGALPVEAAKEEQTRLSVGVGIATGVEFVGNIQAVDRMIWTAIGNTTNLAARLQSLTRDLHAALVIDVTTRERAQAAAADFEKRPDVSIRGRRETQDVYALPMPSDS